MVGGNALAPSSGENLNTEHCGSRGLCQELRGTSAAIVREDNMCLVGSGEEEILRTVEKLKERFESLDLGDMLNLCWEDRSQCGGRFLTQEIYARTVLETYIMDDARQTKTPAGAAPTRSDDRFIFFSEET